MRKGNTDSTVDRSTAASATDDSATDQQTAPLDPQTGDLSRRSVVLGAATVASLSGCLDDDSESDGDEPSGPPEPPFEVTTVDGPGSEAGTVSVPAEGQVQLVNCIRITCPTSRGFLSRVGEARDRLAETYDVGPDGDVHVLTVIDEGSGGAQSAAELGDWWAEQNGNWTVGVDDSGALFDYHDVTGTPTTFAIDGTGEVHWRDEGGTATANVVGGVETALENASETDY